MSRELNSLYAVGGRLNGQVHFGLVDTVDLVRHAFRLTSRISSSLERPSGKDGMARLALNSNASYIALL